MKISYKWLKEYVDFDLTPQETAEALTSTGLEVGSLDEVETVKGGLRGLFVGKVLTCEQHPDSDHLHVTTVDLGKEEPQQIVCGAPNVAAGQKVIVADIGCKLYDGDKEFTIKKGRLRGVDSYGMICAEDEIGVGSDHEGIIVLPDDAVVGMPAAEYYHLESDWVIDIDITANRADALSHYGVARDLYAWLLQRGYKTDLHRPDCSKFRVDNEAMPIEVEIENVDACRRYACLSVTGCDIKESPKWLQDKLTVIGLRPINNIVDITNYIMMAYGQPMHCFDADKVDGHKIVVRTQPEGTKFITLDGVEHTLGEHDLSICNAEAPMCIAGIFGGKGSGTYETTRDVVLESAYFHPGWIRKSARHHGLSTDASFRFERGVDPNGTIYALKQAAILCQELAGGKVSMQIKDVYPNPLPNFNVRLNYEYCDRLIGKKLGREVVKGILASLEMNICGEDELGLDIVVPAYRVDVQRPCDVVEDILRIYGYNNVEIPMQLKSSLTVAGAEDKAHRLENIVCEQLVGCGFNEILNNSLTKETYYAKDELNAFPWSNTAKIMNPLSTDLGVMRQTLLFGGLESLARNINRKRENLKFFEVGNVYRYSPEKDDNDASIKAYSQEYHLALWLTGKRVDGAWMHPDEPTSFYELKAYVMNVFARVGMPQGGVVESKTVNDIFAYGLTLKTRNGKVLAEYGKLAKKVTHLCDVDKEVFYAELNWTAILSATKNSTVEFKELSKYPSVSRDLALLVDENVEFAQVEQIAHKVGKILKNVTLFDVYQGKNLPGGKKSYAVNFVLEDEERTLSEKQIDSIMQKLIINLKKQLGAELR